MEGKVKKGGKWGDKGTSLWFKSNIKLLYVIFTRRHITFKGEICKLWKFMPNYTWKHFIWIRKCGALYAWNLLTQWISTRSHTVRMS